MPRLRGLTENMHYEISFHFYCQPWAYAYGLACRAYRDCRAGQMVSWDRLEDIGVGLVQAKKAGTEVGNTIIEKARAKDSKVFDFLPTNGEMLYSSDTESIVRDQVWIATGIVTGSDVPISTSYISIMNMGADKEAARVSLNTLAAVRMAVNREEKWWKSKDSNIELHPVEGLKFQKPIPFPAYATVKCGLWVEDVVPTELIVTLIGVKTREVI